MCGCFCFFYYYYYYALGLEDRSCGKVLVSCRLSPSFPAPGKNISSPFLSVYND